MMDDPDRNKVADTAAAGRQAAKRRYRSPQLTEYGSIEDLVDAGVVGTSGTVPSITSK
jgi:hypothetical protein